MEVNEVKETSAELVNVLTDVKNTMNLYTAEATNWLLEIGHFVEFSEGKKVSFGRDDFKIMTFHADGFKPEGELINALLKKHPELVIPYYNAEMVYRHIDLLIAPIHLKARHEEYVIKLNKAANLLDVN